MTTINITGADVFTPRAATEAMQGIAGVYADLLANIEQARANLTAAGVTGAPIEMLDAMVDAATVVTAAATGAASKFAQHQQVVADTVGSDPSLAGTQSGRYMDPSDL